MRLSVIMCVRDVSDSIRSIVSANLRRLPPDSELVVLDDASGDDTVAALARINDPRLRAHYSTWPLGVPHSLNHLLAITDSQFVARATAEGRPLPGRFAVEMRALRRHDVVFAGVAGRGRSRARRSSIPSHEFASELLEGDPICHPAFVARRSILELVGGYTECAAPDYDLMLRLAASGARLRRIPRPTLWERQGDERPCSTQLDDVAESSFRRLRAVRVGASEQ